MEPINPVNENEHASHAANETNQSFKESESKIIVASSGTNREPPVAQDNIAHNPEKSWWDKTKPWVELIGISLLAVYTGFTIAMYFANKKAADAAATAAKIAQEQAELTRQQLRGTQAALLQVEILPRQYPDWGLIGGIHNVGVMRATKVGLTLQITRQRFMNGAIQSIGRPVIFNETPEPIKGGGRWPPVFYPQQWRVPWIRLPQPGIQRKTWPNDWPGGNLTEIKIHLAYDDGFERVESDECRELLPSFYIKIRDGGMTIGDGTYPSGELTTAIVAARSNWEKLK